MDDAVTRVSICRQKVESVQFEFITSFPSPSSHLHPFCRICTLWILLTQPHYILLNFILSANRRRRTRIIYRFIRLVVQFLNLLVYSSIPVILLHINANLNCILLLYVQTVQQRE